MAEAHAAVAFGFAVTHEGVDINFDREVLQLVWQSGIRSWRKRFNRIKNNIKNDIYPGSLASLAIIESVVGGSYYMGYDLSHGVIDKIQSVLPAQHMSPEAVPAVGCAIFGFGAWFGIIATLKYSLKALYQYQGWMFEARGRHVTGPTIKTKLWATMVRLLTYRKPMLYSFQGALPGLPVPSVEDTMQRYLRSVRPLLDDEKFARMEKLAKEFEVTIGQRLQRYLVLKSWWASNYVSDWWEEYVYLRGRSPIMVNSNFYGIDALFVNPTHLVAARAGNIIASCLSFRRMIERQEIQPIMVQGLVPLCSWQYERMFNTTRVPGIDTDRVYHLNDTNHIVVLHKGCYYKVIIYTKKRHFTAPEIESQIVKILEDTRAKPDKGEEHLGALTATDRVTWAKARREHFAKGINRASLEAIEKAAFVVVLDDEEYGFDPKDPEKLNKFGRALLHGKGHDRWYDKSFNLIFSKNARVGFNAEHSWADAGIIGHLWEAINGNELTSNSFNESGISPYTDDGHCRGKIEMDPPAPIRLKWDMSDECVAVIESSLATAEQLLNDVDLEIMMHTNYGKGFMKTCKVSPDAFIQMALQLAYYRDAGKFCLTYEASMTRLFKEGRTETVRPCTVESSNWVKAMDAKPIQPNEDKIQLLRKACSVHQRAYQDAMCGKGIDRHLFCLYVISKYLELDSSFLKEVLSEPWRLSTSQTPQGQTRLDLVKHPNYISAGGGFGPVADDGYGVSYIVAGEDVLFFHVSSKRSSVETNSKRFARQIERALADIKALFADVGSVNGAASGKRKNPEGDAKKAQ